MSQCFSKSKFILAFVVGQNTVTFLIVYNNRVLDISTILLIPSTIDQEIHAFSYSLIFSESESESSIVKSLQWSAHKNFEYVRCLSHTGITQL